MGNGPGRPSTLYLELMEQVTREYDPGTRVRLKDFVDRTSAYTARMKLLDGSRPIPGDMRDWQIDAHVEDVECADADGKPNGQMVRGSALFVTWHGTVNGR